jgi:hypothetical protein
MTSKNPSTASSSRQEQLSSRGAEKSRRRENRLNGKNSLKRRELSRKKELEWSLIKKSRNIYRDGAPNLRKTFSLRSWKKRHPVLILFNRGSFRKTSDCQSKSLDKVKIDRETIPIDK